MTAVLDNGVVFLSEPIATSRTIAVGFWFSVGSRYEKENQKGITHFVEHILFKGTNPSQKYPQGLSAYDIACAFDRMGGYINAFTEREDVCVHFTVPYIHFNEALSILSEMVCNSAFDKSDIEKERSVICSEILATKDDPEDSAMDELSEVLWPNNAVSSSIAGSVNDVNKIKRSSLVDWYSKYIKNGALQVTIAGNFTVSEAVVELEKLPTRPIVKPGLLQNHKFELPVWHSGITVKKAEFQMEQIFCAFPLTIPFTRTDYYCWAILNALIGDTMSSRLFQSLRENGGYCYNVYSFFCIYDDCGFWCAYASTPSNKTGEVLRKLKEEITNLRTATISDDEIVAAKEHICGEEIINAEDVEQHMKKMSRQFSLGFEAETIEQTLANVRAISKKEIMQALNSLFCPEKQAVFIYGPKIKRRVRKSL